MDGPHAPVGFYLATIADDAWVFAAFRSADSQVCIIEYELTGAAREQLLSAGATQGRIPGGQPPYFVGEELFVPVVTFDLFNHLLVEREINVRSR
jgi:hypothetical protein